MGVLVGEEDGFAEADGLELSDRVGLRVGNDEGLRDGDEVGELVGNADEVGT